MTDVITLLDKLKCAERELKMREFVYPRWTESKKISEGKAAHELACMKAIVNDYRQWVEDEQ